MDIIQLLPDSVANQIAAGEVIQRPASVIKELVENAVDAEATRIDILVIDAGRTSIQVVDNGKGMTETDARLAFERHATSKIRKASDLFALTTMGFRGEALPSIAAVAQVELMTRTADSELGTKVQLEGSRLMSQEPVSCAVGANFVVKNLFFNTPARRKFLKSNQTEMNNISAELERIALVHPDIAFTLSHNGTQLLSLTPSSLKGRIASVFGKRLADQLLSVEVDTPMVHIRGYVAKPEAARKRGAQQFFFAGGRFMRHPYFHKAVQEAFSRLLSAEEQVPYFIYFDVDPSEIDVNIHPTKTEIKFENEQAIWQILLAAIRESLGRFNAIPTIEFDTAGKPADIPVFRPASAGNQPSAPHVQVDPSFNPFHHSSETTSRKPSVQGWENLYPQEAAMQHPVASPKSFDDLVIPEDVQLTLNLTSQEHGTEHLQYHGTYVLTAVQSGLMFIDQHRAHVRVLYEKYMNQTGDAASQTLLFPDILQLTTSESDTLEGLLPELVRIGFDISSLGGGSWSIAAFPSGLEGIDLIRLISDLVSAQSELGRQPAQEVRHTLALTLARTAALPAGQLLTSAEMQDLIDQLFATQTPNFTPDGKPIIAILKEDQIEKMF